MKYVYLLSACWGIGIGFFIPEQPLSVILSILGATVIINTFLILKIFLK